jgi:hypothetical protein
MWRRFYSTPRLKASSFAAALQSPVDAVALTPNVSLSIQKSTISLAWKNKRDSFGQARLRDNCKCSHCVDPSTRQRNHTSGSVQHARIARAFQGYDPAGKHGLHVDWQDGHASFYTADDLTGMTRRPVDSTKPRVYWDRPKLEESDLRMPYGSDLLRILHQVQTYGVAIITGVPTDFTDDKRCELRKFISSIGELRNTIYGETWDVRAVQQSKNIAYTSVDLGLHMDLLYYANPPRFQALHCLRNKVKGGSSYVADAFFAAEHLKRTDPDAHEFLSTQTVAFEYDNDQHYLYHRHTVIGKLDSLKGAVNWSPPFQAAVRGRQDDERFYRSMAAFEAAINRPQAQYEYTMAEGDLMLFDNRRVLHARRAFESGERWLKGCYIEGEALWDKLVQLQRQSLGS